MDFKNILVPVDGSEPSKRAVAKAVRLAQLCGSRLLLLYVVDLNKQLSAFEQVSTGGFVTSDLKEEGYQVLTQLVREIPPELSVKPRVEIGSPGDVIVEIAAAEESDIIVMGCRGLGTIKQLMMGSVSQSVLHQAKCAVMTVR